MELPVTCLVLKWPDLINLSSTTTELLNKEALLLVCQLFKVSFQIFFDSYFTLVALFSNAYTHKH